MITINIRYIEERELDNIEDLLDKLLGTKSKKGLSTGPALEQISGKTHAGRKWSYKDRNERAELNARLLDGSYDVTLVLNLSEARYVLFLRECQGSAPHVFSKLPKLKVDKKEARYS